MESKDPRKKALRIISKYKPILIVAGVLVGLTFLWSLFSSTSSVFQFVFSSNQLKSTDDRVNILLLGNAGGNHDGPYLTDSIIVASYHLKSHKVTLISIPRDLWLDSIKAKVNAVYEIGERDKKGLKFAMDKIDDILGVPVHYGLRLDFRGFEKAVDVIGGIDVEVPKTFDDYNYPIAGKEEDLCGLQEKELELNEEQAKVLNLKPGKNEPEGSTRKYKVIVDSKDRVASQSADFACRFERIHFDAGITKMDGKTALKFVRSRMGTNGEGSDFARSRRQQLVLQAFRSKALSLQTLTDPQKIAEMIKTFDKSFETDIPPERYLDFYRLVNKQDGTDSIVLGDLGDGKSVFVVGSPSVYGAFVVIPPDNDFTPVKEFVKKKLEEDARI